MSVTDYVLVAGHAGISALVETAVGLGGATVAVVVGPAALVSQVATAGVDRVVWLGEPGDRPWEAYAPAVATVVAESPGVVIGGRRPAERVLLGAAAAALSAPLITGATGVAREGDTVVVTREVYGGIAGETLAVDGPVALLLDGGAIPAVSPTTAPIEERTAAPLPMIVEELRAPESGSAELGGAPRVVAVGRGLREQADLTLVESLAGALRAEIGCTRPLAEGLEWLARDRYIGISGQHIAPDLYVAVGISGQLQHLAGVSRAGTIVAINTDPKAPIAAAADYVLTGDLYELVPALVAALS